MFFNYYRVFPQGFPSTLQVVLQIVITTLYHPYMLLSIIVNKGRSQLELYVSYLCLTFKLTLPQSHRETPECDRNAVSVEGFQSKLLICSHRKAIMSESLEENGCRKLVSQKKLWFGLVFGCSQVLNALSFCWIWFHAIFWKYSTIKIYLRLSDVPFSTIKDDIILADYQHKF